MAGGGGSLRRLFERPLPENHPTLVESLSWNHRKAVEPAAAEGGSAFAEIFGELNFEEIGRLPASDRRPPSVQRNNGAGCGHGAGGPPAGSLDDLLSISRHRYAENAMPDAVFSPSAHSADSLHACTEGLGFESSDDVEICGAGEGWESCGGPPGKEMAAPKGGGGGLGRQYRRSRSDVSGVRTRGDFPPPISCIGSGGKPCVRFKSYREDGRFVLREVKIPTQELLRASREGGRLKLHFAQPPEDIFNKVDEEEEEEEGGGGSGGGDGSGRRRRRGPGDRTSPG